MTSARSSTALKSPNTSSHPTSFPRRFTSTLGSWCRRLMNCSGSLSSLRPASSRKESIPVEGIFEETGEYKVSATENRYADELDWKDIQLPATDYVTDVFPVSSLPNSPEGRIQTVTELAQAGYISPRTAKRLLAFPDLQTEQDLSDSREEYIHSILEEIVEDGKYTAPEPFDDLTLARELALQEYALGKLHGLEEDKLELLRRFMSQLDVFEEEAKQQAAAAAAAQAAASGQLNQPPSPAVPPRPSDLVPNSVKATA